MARTTINSLGIPADTIVSADLDYPLTDFSSTGIDDNASSTSLTIDSSGNITVTGTVDGRDLATDGTKLDGIAASATNYGDSDVATYISGNRSYGNITTTGYIAGPSTFTIDPAAVGDNTGTLVIAGNLQVDGTTTTINSTTMTVDDLNITLASGAANAAAANGAGITVDGASATLTYNGTNDDWNFNKTLNVTGNLKVDSNAANVTLTLENSTNANGYIQYAADGTMRFYTGPAGGSTGIRTVIDNAGNVGINTTSSPLARLHVKGENGNQLSLDNDASQFTQANWYNNGAQKAAIWYDNSKAEFASYSTTELTFYTGGNSTTAIATIDSSGNLGIGTNSPSYALEVYRLVPNSGIISRFASGSSGGWIQLADTNGSWQMGSTSNGLEFYADAPTSQYRLTLSSSGNLGIGTRTPGNTLTVNKDTGSTPTVYINNSGGDAGDGVALKVQASGRGVGVKDADVFSVHNNAGEIFTVRNDGYAEAATGFAVPFKHFPDASFGGAGNTTGRIKIALPDTANDYDMVTIELTVYQYNDTAGSKILISGHNWSNNGWYYVSVQVIGKYNKSIKLARSASDNKYYILLGDTTDNWSYVTVHVNEVTTAPFYSTVTDWTQGWSITQVSTDTTTYSAISGDYNTTGSRTLKTNGYVNSSGIIFGSATAAANALDDYEEGTYTPVYAGTSATGSTTYGYQQGVYTKIGRTVTVWIDITITAMSGASGTPIITLPFVSGTSYGTDVNGNIINDMGGFISWQIADTFTSTSRPTGWVPNNSGAIHMYRYTTGGAGSLSAWILNTTGRISGKIIYTAAF